MKRVRTTIILFAVLMTATLLVLLLMKSRTDYKGRDITVYNDQLLTMQKEYLNGADISSLEEKYGCRIILSKSLTDSELSKYYGRRAMVIDFAPGGEYLGKAVWDDSAEVYEKERNSFFTVALIFWGAILISGIILILVLYFRMVRPVQELSRYSAEIARGNLDVPLPMKRDGISESFTESFDLMREELRAAREREAQAEKAKKELMADLSHDIKTPVATIQATCEVLEMKLARKQAAGCGGELSISEEEIQDMSEKVGSIGAKTETINRIMENVFHSALEDLNQIEVVPKEESTELIEEYFRNIRNYGNILLDNPIPRCLIWMDRLRMEQVIDNVIGNSHKYAGTDIHVAFDEVSDASNTFIRIRISDSGPGVDEDDLPLITEKYFRGNVAKDKSGYGVGMYLVKSYMAKQGGGLEYYNDNGFVVELYVKKV